MHNALIKEENNINRNQALLAMDNGERNTLTFLGIYGRKS